MKIRAAVRPEGSGQAENTFIAVDDLENRLGSCRVEPGMCEELMPDRPCQIRISAEGDESAMMALWGSALTRAMVLAKESGENARIYSPCDPKDTEKLELLRTVGLIDDDAVIRMSRRVVAGPNVVRLPEGCAFVTDDLSDPQERTFFLNRQAQLFRREDAADWLDAVQKKPMMKRLLLISREGLVGELVCWAEQGEGVIGVVYTAPAWRRKGVATYLMEAARQYFSQMRVPECHVDVRLQMAQVVRLAATAGYRQSDILLRLPGMNMDGSVRGGRY